MKVTLADLSSQIHQLTGHLWLLDETMRLMADDLVYALVIAAALLWVHGDGLRAGAAMATGGAAALAIGALIGAIWVEPRPFVVDHFSPLIAHAADASFPSDHLLILGATAGATWLAARPLAVSTAAVALLVASGRVYVGVHYPVDVAVGFLLGTACGIGAWRALGLAAPHLRRLDIHVRRLRPILWGIEARSPGFGRLDQQTEGDKRLDDGTDALGKP